MSSGLLSRATVAPLLLCVMCLLALASCGAPNNTTTTTVPAIKNRVPVTAGFGPTGPAGGFINGIFTTVTLCQHGTSNCITIDNVLVDTGSIGLRILTSALGSVALTPILEGGNPLLECIQYGDTSYSWGPMELGDVEIAGETASNIAIQLLGGTSFQAPQSCLATPVNLSLPGNPPGNEDTLQSLGAYGILGIGNGVFNMGPWDCGISCANNATLSSYYTCPGGNCTESPAPVADQAVNPVAEFTSSDKNGVVITLPSVGAMGTTTVSGTMTFGIATQSDNALGGATVYAMDSCGDFPTVIFNGFSYYDDLCTSGFGGTGGFLDTGSNALYILDASTLTPFGISDCAQNTSGFNFYCVNGGTTTLQGISLVGNGTTQAFVSLNIGDATTLINTNNAVFSNLAGDSSFNFQNDDFDLGLPFFFGRTVFIGIVGVNGQTSGAFTILAPNGFVAF